MKIVLHAFGDKLKGVMEVPEDTSYRFKLVMTQPIQIFQKEMFDKRPMMSSPITKLCIFEWTGGTYCQEGHEYDGARVYQLVDII
jgi:hypothetical protein